MQSSSWLVISLLVACGAPKTTDVTRGAIPVAPKRIAESSTIVGSYRAVALPPPAAPTYDTLLPDALAGTVAAPGDTLDGRTELRKLSIPTPPRGSSATFELGENRRAWVAALPAGTLLPSPTYSNGKVFVSGGFSSQRVFAFDAIGGNQLWSIAGSDVGPTAAISIDHDIVFNTVSCDLYVADDTTGIVRWHKRLAETLMTQPAAIDGALLTAWPKDGGGFEFGAWRANDGTKLWGFDVPAQLVVAPQVVGDSVYFATFDGSVFRVRTRDGHVVWKRASGATSAVAVAATAHINFAPYRTTPTPPGGCAH
jgi:Ca-activated chloride channel family protein